MNNKGFAVTAVIYGLSILGVLIISILMGTLSASRANVKLEADKVESELIAYNKTSVVYNKGEHTFYVPKGETGWYRVEAFGASAADLPGAYTTGIIYLEEGRSIYINLLAGNVSGDSTRSDAIIQAEDASGRIIMSAAGASLYYNMPGGTLNAYFSEPKGGALVLGDFKLENLTKNNLVGTESVIYPPVGPTSYMAGYPGSGDAQPYNGFWYYFVDGLMLPAANKGVSKVIITRLARQDEEIPTIPRKNKFYNNVIQIQIMNPGQAKITGVVATSGGFSTSNYTQTNGNVLLNLNGAKDIDDVSIFFDTTSHPYIKDLIITFVVDNYGPVTIYNSRLSSAAGFTATPTGLKLSAYQLDYSKEPPKYGNYYLIPVLTSNKVVSARKNSESEDNPILFEYIQGTPRQKWAITRVTSRNVLNNPDDVEYYISEESRYKSMAIYHDENIAKNRVVASMTFNNLSRNPPQVWKIYSQYDGTYAIKTVVPSYNQYIKSGFLAANTSRNTDGTVSENYGHIMIGPAENSQVEDEDETIPTNTERFYLYSFDFGNINE